MTGFTQVPHGLWTLDVSTGARVLLGWLHSHADPFLEQVTLNQARRALGTSSVRAWADELTAVGLAHLVQGGTGYTFRLDQRAWKALSQRAGTGAPKSETGAPKPARHRAETGSLTAPVSAHIEDQGEDQREDHEDPPTPRRRGAVDFDSWWALYLSAFGSKVAGSRGKASLAWAKLTAADKAIAVEGVERHGDAWRSRPDAFAVPHGSTWLNQRRFLDETLMQRPVRISTGLQAVQRAAMATHLRAVPRELNHG